MNISRRKRVMFASVAMALSMIAAGGVLLGADLYLHRKAERTAGLNVWGYRGPVVGDKEPGEFRIAFLGGSTMFGYGVGWHEAIPAATERELRARLAAPQVTAINLGYNNEGAYSFVFTLKDYEYLDYDAVVLYEGYNDLMGDPNGPNTSVFRHESAVFRLFGYYPILPLVLEEKAMMLRAGGDLEGAYAASRGEKVVFTPSLGQRTSAAALETASRVGNVLARQLGRFADAPPQKIVATAAGCAYPWAEYCHSVYQAIVQARQAGTRVVVATQPRLAPPNDVRQDEQQAALRGMLARHFGHDPFVVHADLSTAVDLADPQLCFDGMHLTVEGNARVAARLADVLENVVPNGERRR